MRLSRESELFIAFDRFQVDLCDRGRGSPLVCGRFDHNAGCGGVALLESKRLTAKVIQCRRRKRSQQCLVSGWRPNGGYLSMSLSSGARYKAGRPIPRPQSLAKMSAFESSSQAGAKLVHSPPVSRTFRLPSLLCNQICLGSAAEVIASHRPSGEGTGASVSSTLPGDFVVSRSVAGSNDIRVEALCATSSNCTGPLDDCAVG
jgi:hypothetical protein